MWTWTWQLLSLNNVFHMQWKELRTLSIFFKNCANERMMSNSTLQACNQLILFDWNFIIGSMRYVATSSKYQQHHLSLCWTYLAKPIFLSVLLASLEFVFVLGVTSFMPSSSIMHLLGMVSLASCFFFIIQLHRYAIQTCYKILLLHLATNYIGLH